MGIDSVQDYYELHISNLSYDQAGIVAAVLDDLNVAAIEEDNSSLIIYTPDKSFVEHIKLNLLRKLNWLSSDQLVERIKPSKNWNEVWESSFEPIIVDNYCTIRASFHDQNFVSKHIITIDPEMAFGTGHHETTYAMIQAMNQVDFRAKRVLDYGCGTGVLGILAEKEGASNVLAIDYDPIAVECAKKCVNINSCSQTEVIEAELSILKINTHFDIILANINRNVLLDNSTNLASLQLSKGILLLSGILQNDETLVVEKYNSNGYILKDRIVNNEWVCLQFVKK